MMFTERPKVHLAERNSSKMLKFTFLKKKEDKKTKINSIDELVDSEHNHLLEKIIGVIYIFFIIAITLMVLLELKMEYQIDIFPGINSPFDDVYREVKDQLNGAEGNPAEPAPF